jgi:hypothetical protein
MDQRGVSERQRGAWMRHRRAALGCA